MANDNEIQLWLSEADAAINAQPASTWTIARMRFVYPSPGSRSLVQVDTVAAAGNCSAIAIAHSFNTESQRVEIQAAFREFELRGRSSILGPFEILLQPQKSAEGQFRQVFSNSLWPIHGQWTVPFVLVTSMGRLIPKPSDDPVVLRSATPGEFAIPPIGVWFEKWDPINLVMESDPDGPIIAVCEEAMHCMVNVGAEPSMPDFYIR